MLSCSSSFTRLLTCPVLLLVFFLLIWPPPSPTLFPYTTLFRSWSRPGRSCRRARRPRSTCCRWSSGRSEEHTSELQSRGHLVCRLLLEKKKKNENRRPDRRPKPARNKRRQMTAIGKSDY